MKVIQYTTSLRARWLLGLCAAALIVCQVAPASAQVIFGYGGTPNQRTDGGIVVGATFTGFGQTLNSLGFYDHDLDGLATSYQLGLWDATSQTLLATATVTPSSPLIGDFRYAAITPVTLGNPQTFTIGALLPAVMSDIWLDNVFPILGAGYTGAGTGQYDTAITLTYPTTFDESAYYVVNAGPMVVPEPSSLALVMVGLIGLAAFAVRRRGARRMIGVAGLVGFVLCFSLANVGHAAFVIYFSGFTSGTGIQTSSSPLNQSVSGTMQASVPLFNPALGTLIQADYDFSGSTTGSWYTASPGTGASSVSLSGPVDVGGQPMPNLAISFSGNTYDNITPSNDFDADSSLATFTSGPFFNSLTAVGNITLSWVYSGSTSLSVPSNAAGPGGEGFSWGGSAHVMYTYTEFVPEPSGLALGLVGLAAAATLMRGRLKRAKNQ